MKTLTLVFTYCLFSLFAFSQSEENTEPSFKDKLVLDGNISLQFGTFRLIGGNPQIGYRVTEKLVAGVGYSYYVSSYTPFPGTRYNDKLYGPTAFSRFLINPSIFLRGDYQNLTYKLDGVTDASTTSFKRDRLFLGGGYRTQISGRLYATAGAYLDVLDPVAVPYFQSWSRRLSLQLELT